MPDKSLNKMLQDAASRNKNIKRENFYDRIKIGMTVVVTRGKDEGRQGTVLSKSGYSGEWCKLDLDGEHRNVRTNSVREVADGTTSKGVLQ